MLSVTMFSTCRPINVFFVNPFSHCFLLLTLLHLIAHQQQQSFALRFSPPPGNSIAINSTIRDGSQVYRCNAKGRWEPSYRSATLRDPKNKSIILGTYVNYYVRKRAQINAGTWTLANSDTDRFESGHVSSIVAGKKLVAVGENDMGDFLAQASWHKYVGATSKISYIAQFNGTLLSPVPSSHCGVENTTLKRTFSAVYVFWTQDVLPPQVPKSLSISDRPVEAFFGQGIVKYVFNGHTWIERRIIARLYDVPGGVHIGGFSYNLTIPKTNNTRKREDKGNAIACIDVDERNGLHVCGIQQVAPIVASSSSLPWSLFLVTNNTGNMASILGPFSFIHMISTRGGLNSTHVNATNHQVWRSPFTAIFWLYTKRGT